MQIFNNGLSSLVELAKSIGAGLIGAQGGGTVQDRLNDMDSTRKQGVSVVGDNAVKLNAAAAETGTNGGRINIPVGEYRADGNVIPDNADYAYKHVLSGVKRAVSKIKSSLDGVLLYVREGFDIADVALVNDSAQAVGRAIATNDAKQTANGRTSDVDIEGWRVGIWKRYSLWDAYRNLRLKDNTCAIRLARHAYQTDNANPDAVAGWNNWNDGWFHNALTFDNVLCDGGEVGIWAASMCATYMNVTCQNQATDGTANDVLPGTQKGTGILLDAGTDGTRSGWVNQLINYYSEGSQIAAYLRDQRYVGVQNMFVQGGASGDRAEAAIIADNSVVEIDGLTGQDWFENVIDAKNGAVVYLNSQSGALAGNQYRTDATSVIKRRGVIDKARHEYKLHKASGEKTFTLPVTVPDHGIVKIYIDGLYDGWSGRTGEALVINWNGAVATSVKWLTDAGVAPTNVEITVTNAGSIDIKLTGTQSFTAYALIDVIGGADVSGNAIELTGV